MRRRVPLVIVGIALSGLLATVTSTFAQGTLAAPTPIRPLTNGVPNVPGSDAISTGDGARVAFTHVAGATFYHICFRAPGNICQDQFNPPLQSIFPLTARVNSSIPVTAGQTIEFFLPIPNGFDGGRIQWEVKSCTGPNPTQCGQASPFQQVIVLLPQATVSTNSSFTIPNNRTVTLQWTNHPQANRGPQLIILPSGPPTNLSALFTMTNPTVANPPGLSIELQPGATSHTIPLPPALGPAVKWAVANCKDFPSKPRRCSQLISSWKSMRVANFFSTVIVPTMRHLRCVNCHAVAAENFQNDPASNPNGGLPSNHPGVNGSTNCTTCHTNALLPALGNINPGWHAAPASMDFRNRTNAQLCSMAQQNAGGASGFQHLTQDKLILWAVNPNASGNVQLPGAAARPAAPPANIEAWQNAVYSWWFQAQKACD
ncbi:MAG: hypothetical protein GDA67_04645 [Nitrospira sp. CR1.3]|nr:hypothetical protein [Nitrospira sp. CR1.3]